jgi:hypothetical protein
MAVEAQMMAHEIISGEYDGAGAAPDKWAFNLIQSTPSSQGHLLATVAEALATTGASAAAETLLSEITDQFQMARGLVDYQTMPNRSMLAGYLLALYPPGSGKYAWISCSALRQQRFPQSQTGFSKQ